MKWITPSNKVVDISIKKYLIRWGEHAASKEAQVVKEFLFKYCKNHIILEEFRIPRQRLFVDFIDLNYKIAIEHQGAAHFNYIKNHFHKSKFDYLKQMKRDEEKRAILEKNGFRVIETMKKDFPLTEEWLNEIYYNNKI